ncbi:hypothetical protein EMMF5_003559 [Cystobasidiomycetes sp. EMM_F5]
MIQVPLCYATPSAALKLQAIADAGFESIELGMPDLEDYAKQELGDSYKGLSDDDGSGDLESLLKIASQVKSLLDKLRLKVLCLQPFSQFEGYTDEQKRKGKFAKAKVWMDVMEAVGSDMLQVGSTDDKSSTSDRSIVVKDLQELADMAATRSMRIGYEITGREWADPSQPSGLLAGFSSDDERDASLTRSLDELARTIPADKIFYFQISDAQKMDPPINESHPAWNGQDPPRCLWSHDYRPLPYETDKGAYLPVEECTAAVLRTGYRGPFSYEIFYGADMSKDDKDVPARWTKRSMDTHKRLMEACEKRL